MFTNFKEPGLKTDRKPLRLEFAAIQVHDHTSWLDWPEALRDRNAAALAEFAERHATQIEQACFEQHLFFIQWQALRDYAH